MIAAAADKACEIAGAGAMTPDIGALSYGDHGDSEHHDAALFGSDAARTSLPGAPAGAVQREVQIF